MFLHPNHRYAEIDGDHYIMTVPTISMWKRIMQVAVERKLDIPAKFYNPMAPELSEFLIIEDRNQHIEIARSWLPDTSMVYYDTTNGKHLNAEMKDDGYWPVPMQANWPSTHYFPVRPMLLPLDKDGRVDLRLISDPDGSVVEGGSFKIVKYPKDPNPQFFHRGQKPFITGRATDDILWITDTQEDEETILQWVVWHHCLISMETLFSICMEGFWHSMIPWPCEDLVRINAIELALEAFGIYTPKE